MVIKLYISGISGNKEVKKKQQRVQMILDSKQIDYEAIDITEPGNEKDKEFMQQNGKVRESLGKHPLPPQIFNDEDFCGDYEDFDMANEVDELEKFLHIETSAKDSENDSKEKEDSQSRNENHQSVDSFYYPYEYHTFKIKYDGVNGLKEPIINTNDLAGENADAEEVKKSEVNGECETVLETSSENVPENVETSSEEVVILEKEEESSSQEKKTNEGEGEKETEEDKQEQEAKGEEAEKGDEENEKVESPKEEKVENEEETSPPSEDKEADVSDVKKEEEEVEKEEESKEEVESEKEDKESEEEKSQEN